MKENKLLSICVLILSFSVVFGGLWIGNSIRNANKDTNVTQSLYSLTSNRGLMTGKETAEYLDLSQDGFNSLISYQELQRSKLTMFDTYMFIPYIEIDGVKYFSKEQVDKWIEYNMTQRSQINTSAN